MTPKIEAYLAGERPTPCLVVDLEVVAENYARLKRALPLADIFYAVKANPAPEVLRTLVGLSSHFDAASTVEIDQCLAAGAVPEAISYGNVIKKQRDVAYAFERGVRLFAFDSREELAKLAAAAPGASVYCRIAVPNSGADWPLSRKFGCEMGMARDLMVEARDRGLDACGISFHVGSQQTDPAQWDVAIGRTAMVFSDLREAGIDLRMVNLGGGFPIRYRDPVPGIDRFASAIMDAMRRHFGNRIPRLLIEPGRAVVGDAGVIETEVVLVTAKESASDRRWVYLDVGKFGGLAETMDEAIRYAFRTPHDGGPEGPVAIAGPTCDGADILYEKADYRMPVALRGGDRVRLLAAGAYTTTYASIGFNGFAPLREVYLP